jgi:hypothetical protein
MKRRFGRIEPRTQISLEEYRQFSDFLTVVISKKDAIGRACTQVGDLMNLTTLSSTHVPAAHMKMSDNVSRCKYTTKGQMATSAPLERLTFVQRLQPFPRFDHSPDPAHLEAFILERRQCHDWKNIASTSRHRSGFPSAAPFGSARFQMK